MSSKMTTINEKIMFLRQNGMKVGEIAEEIGVSRQFLQQMATGKSRVPLDKMSTIDNLIVKYSGDIHVNGSTVNGVISGHGGTVNTQPQAETTFQAETSKRLSNIERLLIELLSKSSNGV